MEPFHEIGVEPIREMVGGKPNNLQEQVLENAGSKPQNMQERDLKHAGARPRNMQEGVLHDPNYAAWRDEITNDQRKGANPRTCRSNGRVQTQELAGRET